VAGQYVNRADQTGVFAGQNVERTVADDPRLRQIDAQQFAGQPQHAGVGLARRVVFMHINALGFGMERAGEHAVDVRAAIRQVTQNSGLNPHKGLPAEIAVSDARLVGNQDDGNV